MLETHLNRNRQTVKLGLIKTMWEMFPAEEFKTEYSIQNGVFCDLKNSVLSTREVSHIYTKLQEWVESDFPIELIAFKDGYFHYKVGDMIIKMVYPANTSSSMVDPFRMLPFSNGFIVDFSVSEKCDYMKLVLPKKLSGTYLYTQHWLKNINFELVSDVNTWINSSHEMEMIAIAEALQEKEISDIADVILQQRRIVHMILISGPSSSGKTTFAQRLSTQLRVNGLKPVPLSLDNYFVNREQTPLDENGKCDFECLESLDVKLLQHHILQLLNGEEVETPIFDFVTGKRLEVTLPMKLGPSEILLIEGIHALNPNLLPEVNRYELFKIYLGALFELNIDLINRVPTTEVRLLRRIIRGDRFRGTSPEKTIELWANVRKSETAKIFVFAEEADVMFNTSLLYEMNVLRPFAEESLRKIDNGSPYEGVRDRLLNLLSFFEPLESSKVPLNSILREFIGGGSYST